MDSLNSLILQQILLYIKPNQLIVNKNHLHRCDRYHSYHEYPLGFKLVDISLVCWKWFNCISKLVSNLDISFTDNKKHVHLYSFAKSTTKNIYSLENSYIDMPISNLTSKFSLMRMENITDLTLRTIYPWPKHSNPILQKLYGNGNMKTVTIISELTLLKDFIRRHPSKDRFIYQVIPTISNELDAKLVQTVVDYLTSPTNNINWLETIVDSNATFSLPILVDHLKYIEKSLNNEIVDSKDNDDNNNNKIQRTLNKNIQLLWADFTDKVPIEQWKLFNSIKHIYYMKLCGVDPANISSLIKECSGENGSLQKLKLKINIRLKIAPNSENSEKYMDDLLKMFVHLKEAKSIKSFSIMNWMQSKRIPYSLTYNERVGSAFGDLLEKNRNIRRLELQVFEYLSPSFFESLSDDDCQLRNLNIQIVAENQLANLIDCVGRNQSIQKLALSYHFLRDQVKIEELVFKMLSSEKQQIKLLDIQLCKNTKDHLTLYNALALPTNHLNHLIISDDLAVALKDENEKNQKFNTILHYRIKNKNY